MTFRLNINEQLLAKGRRENRRVTLRELARFCGVSFATAANWSSRKGVSSVNAQQMAQLCLFFDLSADEMHELIELEFDTKEFKTISPESGDEASV